MPFKPKGRKLLKEADVKSSHMILCFEESSLKAVNAMGCDHENVKMLSEYYPDKELPEIPDPMLWRDSKSYEKCYWLIYKSVR